MMRLIRLKTEEYNRNPGYIEEHILLLIVDIRACIFLQICRYTVSFGFDRRGIITFTWCMLEQGGILVTGDSIKFKSLEQGTV